MLRSRFLGAFALASSLAALSLPASAATRQSASNAPTHQQHHARASHIHRAQVMDTVARRQAPIAHRSASLMTHDTLTSGHQPDKPA